MNKLKKLSIVTLIAGGIFLGAGQVYAATLNTSIVSIIQSGFSVIKQYFLAQTDADMNNTSNKYKEDVKTYVDTKSTETIADLQNYKNSETSRADKELKEYTDTLKKETNDAIEQEKTKAKKEITDKVNSKIEASKSEIQKQLEDSIKDKLKVK